VYFIVTKYHKLNVYILLKYILVNNTQIIKCTVGGFILHVSKYSYIFVFLL